jgi:hypothetical protein
VPAAERRRASHREGEQGPAGSPATVVRVDEELDDDVGQVVELRQVQLEVTGRGPVVDGEVLLRLAARPREPQPGAVGLEGAERDVGGVRFGGGPVDHVGRPLVGEGNYPQHPDSLRRRLSDRD